MTDRGYREIGLEEHGDECVACGADEDVIHHRDGDKTNNSPSNLVPLCDMCHQRIHAGRWTNSKTVELVCELGLHPVSGDQTTIQLSGELADELHDLKDRGETYENVLWDLLEHAEDE